MVPASARNAVSGLTNHRHDRRGDAAEPRSDNGNEVQHAGDNAERGSVGDAEQAEQDAARNADDGALQKRALDVAAHDARERDMQELGVLGAFGSDEARRLLPSRGSSIRIQNAMTKGEADGHRPVRDGGARREQTAGASCAMLDATRQASLERRREAA